MNDNETTALDRIRVVDATQALAGPYCTQLLGDLGAEVIKIERPGEGDQARLWGPPFLGGESAYFLGTNRNKRSLALDLQQPRGREVVWHLIEQADVFVHNVPRESTRAKLGVDEQTLRGRNSRLIYASITGFGLTGPYAERPGYDLIAQAMSGTMALTGEPESGPVRFPTPIADISTGLYCAMGILAALFARERTGIGQSVDTSLLDSQITWLANVASSHFATGEPPPKLGNLHPSIVPYQPFRTADKWIIVAAGTERHWERLLEVLELAELGADQRFATNAARLQNRGTLIPLLEARFRQRPATTWIERLELAGIPSGPINPVEEALADEHVLARGMVVELEHPAAGLVRSLGNPIGLGKTPIRYRRPAPLLGQHTDAILAELGYTPDQIRELHAEEVVA